MNRTQLLVSFSVLAVAALLALLFLPSVQGGSAPPPVRLAPLADCDLNAGPCRAAIEGVAVSLTIEPRPIEAMKPLTVSAKIEGAVPARVAIDFAGVDMNMGQNRFGLKPAGVGYEGTAMLPVCVRGSMLWEAQLLVDLPGSSLAFPFRFETRRP